MFGGLIWGFPTIRGTLLEAPIIRTIVFWGLYWGPPILGNSIWVLRLSGLEFGDFRFQWVGFGEFQAI